MNSSPSLTHSIGPETAHLNWTCTCWKFAIFSNKFDWHQLFYEQNFFHSCAKFNKRLLVSLEINSINKPGERVTIPCIFRMLDLPVHHVNSSLHVEAEMIHDLLKREPKMRKHDLHPWEELEYFSWVTEWKEQMCWVSIMTRTLVGICNCISVEEVVYKNRKRVCDIEDGEVLLESSPLGFTWNFCTIFCQTFDIDLKLLAWPLTYSMIWT